MIAGHIRNPEYSFEDDYNACKQIATDALAAQPRDDVREALEALEMCQDLIQEAKGHEGPQGGFVTNHLDNAENWLGKARDFLAALSTDSGPTEVQAASGGVGLWRKKPVVVEAMQWNGKQASAAAIIAWMGGAGRHVPTLIGERDPPELEITTLEDGKAGQARHVASPNDWIIRGVQGEFYACKPDIFAETYELASRLRTPDQRDRALVQSAKLPLAVKMAGAEAITKDHMIKNANYDAACDCWDAMVSALIDRPSTK